MKTIFLPTVRHSGTIFLLEFFRLGGFPTVNLDRTLFAGDHIPHHTAAVIHTHIDVNLPVVKALHARAPKPAHELAINFYEYLNLPLADALGRTLPMVIPMRDPLLSVITRHTRHPEQAPHTYLIRSWEWIHDAYGLQPFYVPVDQERSKSDRVSLLMAMLRHCEIQPWAHAPGYAEAWKSVNSVAGATEARAAYARRDKGWFEEHFPEEWATLKSSHDVRRLFKKQGYEDLLWW